MSSDITPLSPDALQEVGVKMLARGRVAIEAYKAESRAAGFSDYVNEEPQEALCQAAGDLIGDIASALFADLIELGASPEEAIATVGKQLARGLSDVLTIVPGGESSAVEADEDFGSVGFLASQGAEGFESIPLFA